MKDRKPLSRRRMALYAGVFAVFVASLLFARPPVGKAEAAFAGEPEIVAATFASAWCSSCKILKPRLAEIIPDFASSPVRFVEYDFTFGENAEIAAKAATDGLGGVFGRFAGATGFTLLVDAQSGEIIDMLTMNHSEDAMRAAIRAAIAVAAANDPQPASS